MVKLYFKLEWPEYQTYQQYEDFDEHAEYCAETNCYFIERDWLIEKEQQTSKELSPDSTTTIEYNGKEIELSSNYFGMACPPWDKKPHHHHLVTIKIGCTKHSFDYWSGPMHYKDTTVMSKKEMIEAFESFLSDAIAANQSIDDFQSEFGYENVSECIRVYNSCKEELEAWKNFFIDPYDLANWLRDEYDL